MSTRIILTALADYFRDRADWRWQLFESNPLDNQLRIASMRLHDVADYIVELPDDAAELSVLLDLDEQFNLLFHPGHTDHSDPHAIGRGCLCIPHSDRILCVNSVLRCGFRGWAWVNAQVFFGEWIELFQQDCLDGNLATPSDRLFNSIHHRLRSRTHGMPQDTREDFVRLVSRILDAVAPNGIGVTPIPEMIAAVEEIATDNGIPPLGSCDALDDPAAQVANMVVTLAGCVYHNGKRLVLPKNDERN